VLKNNKSICFGGVLLEETDRKFDMIFSEIYNRHYSFLFGYLFLIVHDPDVAEDLVHDIFLRLYRSRNSEIAGMKIRNYLKKAAKNIAIDHLRKKAREEARHKKIICEVKELNETFYSSLENSMIEGEVLSTVHDVLEEFSEKKRKVFMARVFENKTFRQLSQEEKISHYEIKRIEKEIFSRLRQKLKNFI